VQAFQTIVGKNGWPSTWMTSPPAAVRSAPVSPGVLSRNGADAPRPSSARASTDTRYAVSKVRPVRVATWSTDGAAGAVQSVGTSTP